MATAITPPPPLEYVRPWLAPYQRSALFGPERYAVVEATTKAGKTSGCMVWLTEQAMQGSPGRNYWWVAPIFPQAKIVYRRLKRCLPREIYETNESELTLTLLNGAVLWFKGAERPDSLYGEDVYAAVIDEATRCKEDAWHALRTTLTATRGPIRIIGNVKGRRNWAYLLARRAEAGEPGMSYAKITARDAVKAGIITAAEVADAERMLPAAVFRELYMAEPSDDAGNPFGVEAIRARVAPLSTNPAAVFGLDLAKSGDWCVLIGLDAAGAVCKFDRWQGPWEVTIQRVLGQVGKVPTLVDSTGAGDPVLEALQRQGRGQGAQFIGYTFSSPSKQKLMEGLSVAIQQKRVSYPDGPIVAELEAFEFVYHRTGVSYCVSPATRVLTADLRYVSAGSLVEGQALLAFDEHPQPGHKTRCWRSAAVTGATRIVRPCSRVTLSDGTVLEVSDEHRWLVKASGAGDFQWRTTAQLRGATASRSPRDAPSRLLRLLPVWSTGASYEHGYLAAAFDGEGSLGQRPRIGRDRGYTARLTFAQKDNAMAAEVRRCMDVLRFEMAEGLPRAVTGVLHLEVRGRRQGLLRFLGEARPKRLLAKFDPDRLGSLDKMALVSVVGVEPLGERTVVAVGTTTGTLIAEGLASHNSAPEGLHDDCVCSLALAVQQQLGASQPVRVREAMWG